MDHQPLPMPGQEGDLRDEPGLADPDRAGDRHESYARVGEQRLHCDHVGVATDELSGP